MLAVKNIVIKINSRLVDNASFELRKGEIVGLAAANGTGKSTLLRTIAGLRTEKSGRASIKEGGKELTFREAKRKIFYFESTNWLNEDLSGRDYLELIASRWKGKKENIEKSIQLWGMYHYIDKPVKTYSLGMKQKLLISLYHVSDADYWLFDEPTLALDRDSVRVFTEFLLEKRSENKSIFFSAHENESFFEICDAIYRIERQKLILMGEEA